MNSNDTFIGLERWLYRMNDIILTKEVLSNEVVSVNYYTLDGIKYGDKKELVKTLNDKGIPM